MNHRKQSEFLERCRNAGEPLVLATVYSTDGSTYSKAGARMLIDGEGRFCGMLSGGCLEGDLAMRARVAMDSGSVQYASYDLRADADDELWGMGVGCEGVMRVMLQAVGKEGDYEPAASILQLQAGRDPVTVVTCVESDEPAVPAGSVVVLAGETVLTLPPAAGLRAVVDSGRLGAIPAPGDARITEYAGAAGRARILVDCLPPVPRVLVLGAGPDAVPLVRLAAELGWQCTVCDHRPAYLESNDFAVAAARHCLPAGSLDDELPLEDFDMAIVMSHHLASDRAYLGQLAGTGISYIGLLGPPARRQRLLADLPDSRGALEGRLHGPAGLDLGGRGPAAIALAIVAEMQMHLGGRKAG